MIPSTRRKRAGSSVRPRGLQLGEGYRHGIGIVAAIPRRIPRRQAELAQHRG
jgi:hypothetical protein